MIVKNNELLTTESGIYQILNTSTNKRYIGSAVNLRKRFSQHKYMLNNNKHHSKYLQNSYNKYGESSFVFKVLEYVDDKNELLDIEQKYLNILFIKEGGKLTYNINKDSSNRLGTKQSKESILKSKLNNPNRRDILQFDFNGNFIKEWLSASDIERELGLFKASVLNVCKNISEYSGDYIFIYKDEYDDYSEYLESLKTNPYLKKAWNKGLKQLENASNKNKVLLFTRYGVFVDNFDSQKEVCEFIKSSTSNVSSAKNKKIIKNYYIFDSNFDYDDIINKEIKEYEFYNSITPTGLNIIMYDIFGNKITSFNSIAEASVITGFNQNSIHYVVSGKRKQLKGYIFKKNEDIV